jgi:hypothetical protein
MSLYVLTPRPTRVDVHEYTGDAADVGDMLRSLDAPAMVVDNGGDRVRIRALHAAMAVRDLVRLARGLTTGRAR